MSARVTALVTLALALGGVRQGPTHPTAAERAAFRKSLVTVADSGLLRWQRLPSATGYEVLSSPDGRRYGLEDLVTGTAYRVKQSPRGTHLWFRVVAMQSAKVLLDTTTAVRLDGHATR